jgi:hypothetical protein
MIGTFSEATALNKHKGLRQFLRYLVEEGHRVGPAAPQGGLSLSASEPPASFLGPNSIGLVTVSRFILSRG